MSPKDFPQPPLAMSSQQYCLKWNNHQVNLLRAFDRLLQSESFTDVTLACEGRSLRAHKVVLSACSSYFETLFEEHPDKSPIIILKDMKFNHVSQLVNFMYRGEINITQDMLSGLLRTAETLKIKGLAEVSGEQQANANNISAQPAPSVVPPPPIQNPFAQLQTHFRIGNSFQNTLPRLVTSSGSSVLTAALNAPVNNSLAPLAALLNPDATLTEHRHIAPKRMSIDDESNDGNILNYEHPAKHHKRDDIKDISLVNSTSPPTTSGHVIPSPFSLNHFLTNANKHENHKPRKHKEKEIIPAPDVQPVLTPIPNELTVNAQQELPEFLKNYPVFRLNDYLGFRTRQQFWEEPAVRRIMEGIKSKEIDMKSAAEILGVSYGTLYGRYREVFGYLKHAWVNSKSGKSPSATKEKNIWEESRAQDLVQRVLMKELSLTAAAVRLGVDYNTFFAHVTDNGKNLERVALLTGSADDGDFPQIPSNLHPNASPDPDIEDVSPRHRSGSVDSVVKEEYNTDIYDFPNEDGENDGEMSDGEVPPESEDIDDGAEEVNGAEEGTLPLDLANSTHDENESEMKEVANDSASSEEPPREMPRLISIKSDLVG